MVRAAMVARVRIQDDAPTRDLTADEGSIAVPEPQGRDRTVDHRGARFGEGGLRR